MPWYYAVAERDHEIQNPTSAEKILLLGERLRLSPDSHVLDVACGKCGPAILLARKFGCAITGIERASEFAAEARERIAASGLADRIEVIEADASRAEIEPAGYDAAMCLGASFVWADLAGTLPHLRRATRPGGHVVVGEPYWRRWPLPDGIGDDGYVSLHDTVDRFRAAGLTVETLIDSSLDDWDRYETLHWQALEDWLAAHPGDPEADELRRRHEANRDGYLRWQRDLLGWAIFVGRNP
ncbi:MAG: methyltransferase domain-containing protein [Actinobacteria bacterium]|nr:MAG: methyltransferase domain-containing protein [Actinomycetota bacterium]